MRSAFAALLLLTLAGCSDDAEPTAAPTTETSACPEDTPELLGPPTRVATDYLEALRAHDGGAIYDLAAKGLQAQQSRAEFVAGLDIDGVQAARISGVTRTGYTDDGALRAVVPIEVTVAGVVQEGRVVLTRERGQWRFVAAVSPPEAPGLSCDPRR